MKIVIVDDSIDNIKLMKLYSKKSNDEFYYFTSPEDSIVFINSNSVELVFLDLHMPILDGFDVLAEIKNKEQVRCPFVCALTAVTSESEVLKITKSPFDDFLQKPIFKDQFLNYIESLKLKKAS